MSESHRRPLQHVFDHELDVRRGTKEEGWRRLALCVPNVLHLSQLFNRSLGSIFQAVIVATVARPLWLR